MMNIELRRNRHRPDTIDGQIRIDGRRVCDCAENAHTALPPGTYSITIVHCRQYARKMPLITPISNQSSVINNRVCPMLCPGNGVYNREDGSIIVGEYLVPGCLKHSKTAFDNLYDRIRKNLKRGNDIMLTIR